jgi:hypothetical protein
VNRDRPAQLESNHIQTLRCEQTRHHLPRGSSRTAHTNNQAMDELLQSRAIKVRYLRDPHQLHLHDGSSVGGRGVYAVVDAVFNIARLCKIVYDELTPEIFAGMEIHALSPIEAFLYGQHLLKIVAEQVRGLVIVGICGSCDEVEVKEHRGCHSR